MQNASFKVHCFDGYTSMCGIIKASPSCAQTTHLLSHEPHKHCLSLYLFKASQAHSHQLVLQNNSHTLHKAIPLSTLETIINTLSGMFNHLTVFLPLSKRFPGDILQNTSQPKYSRDKHRFPTICSTAGYYSLKYVSASSICLKLPLVSFFFRRVTTVTINETMSSSQRVEQSTSCLSLCSLIHVL